MIWTGAFALLALLISAQQIDASLSALRQLAGVHLNEAFSVKQRCRTYENLLASSNPPPPATMGRDQLFKSILDGLQSHETAALDSNEARVFNDLRECLGLAAKPAAPSSQVAATPLTPATKTAPATTFDRADLVALSRAQQETKGLPLHARCQTLSETLKSVFADNADYLALASRDGLMATTIAELSARQLPFGNSQPVLAALQECVTNFPEFQAGGTAAHQRLNVIAAPVKNVAPAATGGSPMQRAHEEFNKVKNNVKDFGQDLYSGGGGNGGATGHQPHGLNQAHRHEQPLGESHHASHQASHHTSHSPAAEVSTELERKFAEVLQKFNSERSRRESLEHELEQERSARAQLEAHSADLERELAYAQQLLSQQVGRVHPRYLVDNDDDDDDDDDDDEDDIERRQGKLKDLVNKDKAGKKDKKDKKKDKEGEEKVYEDPVDIARKLQDKMNASERPESRCQKYYMALNYPGKVGKKFIKWLAKLPLPGAAIAPEAHYYESLANYVQVLARSRNKNSRLAARELEQCLEIHSSAPIYDHHQPPPQYQHPALGPNEIPVEDVRTRGGGGGFVHPPPVLYDDLRPGAQEIPVTFANAGVKPGKKVHNWSYAHASASSGAGPRFPELPPFPDFY